MAETTEPVRILIVDDDPGLRAMVKRWVTRKLGAEAEEAADGSQALDLLRRKQFHILLLDLSMPHVNGIRVLEQMEDDAASRGLEVIVLSGVSGAKPVVRVKQLGAVDYLLKPLQFEETVARVGEAIARVRPQTAPTEPIGKALLADSDVDFCRAAKEALGSAGIEVFTSHDVAGLMTGTLRHRPDLIVMSDNLPGLQLNSVLSKLKRSLLPRKLKICLLTSEEPQGKGRGAADVALFRGAPLESLRREAKGLLGSR